MKKIDDIFVWTDFTPPHNEHIYLPSVSNTMFFSYLLNSSAYERSRWSTKYISDASISVNRFKIKLDIQSIRVLWQLIFDHKYFLEILIKAL